MMFVFPLGSLTLVYFCLKKYLQSASEENADVAKVIIAFSILTIVLLFWFGQFGSLTLALTLSPIISMLVVMLLLKLHS